MVGFRQTAPGLATLSNPVIARLTRSPASPPAPIGVGMSARPPLPPNRACGSPAHGSPVESFHIVTEYPFKAPGGERTLYSEGLRPRFRYQNLQQVVPSVSSQCHGSEARFFPSSETCLAISGTQFRPVRRSLDSSVPSSLFLTNFPQPGFASHASRSLQQHRYYSASDSCLRHLGDRSPRLSHTNFPAFRLQPHDAPQHRFYRHYQRAERFPDFAMNEQARRHIPPNRVRHPADCQFASGCSPPRLATTQLPSASGSWLAPARTSTMLFVRLHGRTHSRESGNPESAAENLLDSGIRRNDG